MRKIFLILMLVLIDQVIKRIVILNIDLNHSIEIIKDFFYLWNVRNFGAAFSIFDGKLLFLIATGVLASIYLIYLIVKKQDEIAYYFLFGGLIGNLIDRIFLGYVIDYLGFEIFGYHFPIFNFADILITLSATYIILSVLKEEFKNGTYCNKKRLETR
jgi:signal peptidase II